MNYPDGEQVETFDVVSFSLQGEETDGVILKILPRAGRVDVQYQDWNDTTRDGGARRKRTRVDIDQVELVRRDG